MSNSLSRMFMPVVVAGSALATGCANTPSAPVNTTTRVAAVADTNVKISRCEDKGFLVLPANAYNTAQVARGSGNVQSQLVRTNKGGDFFIQYPTAIGVNSNGFSRLTGAVAGAAVGGAGIGRVVGAVLGAEFLGPVMEAGGEAVKGAVGVSNRDKVTRLAECISDVAALNGGLRPEYANAVQGTRQMPVQPRMPSPYPYGQGVQRVSPVERVLNIFGQ
jgi:hypothetical protein